MIKYLYRFHVKYLLLLSYIHENLILLRSFLEITILNFRDIRHLEPFFFMG
jgi:hypothetical protein